MYTFDWMMISFVVLFHLYAVDITLAFNTVVTAILQPEFCVQCANQHPSVFGFEMIEENGSREKKHRTESHTHSRNSLCFVSISRAYTAVLWATKALAYEQQAKKQKFSTQLEKN